MDGILPPYDFSKYVFTARTAVLTCSAFELLLLISGSLEQSNTIAKLFFFLFTGASIGVTAHNISLNINGRKEIKKVLDAVENEVRGRSAALILTPSLSALFAFMFISGHFFFSFFVLIHVLCSFGQLAIEVFEVRHEDGSETVGTTEPPVGDTVIPEK